MKESDIQKKIIDYLHSEGAWTVKTIQCNKSGVPDILACINGRFIAFEVKTEIGRATALQERTIKQIKHAGGISAIVRSVEEAENVVNNFRRENPYDEIEDKIQWEYERVFKGVRDE